MKMREKLIILMLIGVLSVALPNYSVADFPPPDRKAMELVGSVRSVTHKSSKLKEMHGSWNESEIEIDLRLVFDEAGRTTEAITYDSRGAVVYRWVIKFDSRGNLTERVIYTGGKVTSRETFSFDDRDRLVQKVVGDPPRKRYIIVYRPDGRIGERHYYGSNSQKGGAPKSIIYYSYDLSGNKIEERKISSKKVLIRKRSYKYDDAGRCIESAIYGSDGALRARFTTKYDTKGNKAVEATYEQSFNREVIKEMKRYDSAGNVIEELSYSGGDPITFTENKYDARGNKIKQTFYSLLFEKPREVHRFTFSYDRKGNLIKMKKYEHGHLMELDNYKYTYDNHGNWVKRIHRYRTKLSNSKGPWFGDGVRFVKYQIIEYY